MKPAFKEPPGERSAWNRSPKPPPKRRSRSRKYLRRSGYFVYFLLVVLLCARIALPGYLKDYVNKTLNKIPGYSGSVGDIDVHLWRGAYKIIGCKLEKESANIKTPFFAAKQIDLSVEWRQLLHGALVGEMEFYEPELNFIKAKSKKQSQTSIDQSFQQRVQDLFPFKINRFEVVRGRIKYTARDSTPPINFDASKVTIIASNITNSVELSKDLYATVNAKGTLEDQGLVTLSAHFDPYARVPTFDLDAELKEMDLTRFNDFFQAKAGFDVEAGRISIYSELVSTKSKFDGYAKVIIKDAEVISLEKDAANPLSAVWQSLVATVVEIFTNRSREQFAAKIPISGSYDNPETGNWRTFFSVVRNAFIEALKPSLENSLGQKSS